MYVAAGVSGLQYIESGIERQKNVSYFNHIKIRGEKIMDVEYLRQLLKQIADKKTDIEEALTELKKLPYEDIGYANIDQHRNLRTGQGEVIFGQGKTPEQIAGIVTHMMKENKRILVTRADEKDFSVVLEIAPDAVFEPEAKVIMMGEKSRPDPGKGVIAILTAGTSDIPVAQETAFTAEFFGYFVDRIFDVGVAGIHRLFDRMDRSCGRMLLL